MITNRLAVPPFVTVSVDDHWHQTGKPPLTIRRMRQPKELNHRGRFASIAEILSYDKYLAVHNIAKHINSALFHKEFYILNAWRRVSFRNVRRQVPGRSMSFHIH